MNRASLRLAQWHRHVNGVNPPPALRPWLTGAASLTARLTAHCQRFRVRRLHQRRSLCLDDEAGLIGLPRRVKVWEREVLLQCDAVDVVFAHTIVANTANASDWPLFGALGERSLGSILFGDPQVRRGALEYARIKPGHPLHRRAQMASQCDAGAILYARRCTFRRRQGLLLVTEVFLPALQSLRPAACC